MKRIAFLFILLCVFSVPALSNDGWMLGASGSVEVMEEEHPTVAMLDEWVRMDVYPLEYKVSVQFVFYNDGPATTVKMGFPEWNSGYLEEGESVKGFTEFKTYVDGRRVKARRVAVPSEPDVEDYIHNYYWVKTVHFKKNQKRIIRVEYTSEVGFSHGATGLWHASYSFTGSNWAGKIRNTYFLAVLHVPKSYGVYHSFGNEENAHNNGRAMDNRLSWHISDYEPDYHGAVITFTKTNEENICIQSSLSKEQDDCCLDDDDIAEFNRFKNLPPPDFPLPVVEINNTAFVASSWINNYIPEVNCDIIKEGAKPLSIFCKSASKEIEFKLNKKGMWVDGEKVFTRIAPVYAKGFYSSDEYYYIPLRPIAEALGIPIQYDKKCHKVLLGSSKNGDTE